MTFEQTLQSKKKRKTPISWIDLIGTILDQYYQHVDDISHAVQKDAIQNSWDARSESDLTKWKTEFKFFTDSLGKRMLIMEDHGTTGLTGKILPEEEYDKDLPDEERWGRFQGLAFTRESPKALGARGQGKFVFVGGSKNERIVYDTLRGDGVYRMGVRTLGDVVELEGKEAEDLLKLYSPDLHPLDSVGTRVIIDEPTEELESSIRSERFIRYIQTTWWPLLSDYNANITVKWDGEEHRVAYPPDFVFPSSDSKDFKVWIKDRIPLHRKSCKGLVISKLRICWSKNPVEEDIRGIAIIRGGMVVERIPVTDLLPAADPELAKRLYGYAEGDMGVQLLLKKLEDPTHYRFGKKGGWGRKNIYGLMKDAISSQLQLFASEKLGAEKETTEDWDYPTIKKFNSIIKSIGISLEGLSPPGGGGGGGGGPRPPINLVFPLPKFSNPMKRVDYGDEIKNLKVKISNTTKSKATVMLKIETEQESLTREVILSKTYPPIPSRGKVSDGQFSFEITKNKYTDGRCRLKARLICLQHPDYLKGQELHRISHPFWIAQDPPLAKGPFRQIKRSTNVTEQTNGKVVSVDAKVVPHPEGGYNLIMNVGHPIYKQRCKNRDDEPEYEIDLMAKKLPHVLMEEDIEPFKGVEDSEKILKLSWTLYSEILGKYYGH